MATLNGTQINQTYKGLIKLTDNSAAGGSLRELTDGFGNGLGLFVNTGGAFTAQGDLTVQGNIDATGANKIAFYYADQSTFPNANTYHGALAHSHADGKMYFAHGGAWIEIANSSDLTAAGLEHVLTEYVQIPFGATADRPTTPAAGMLRYNTDLNELEGYTTEWGSIGGADPSVISVENFNGDDTTVDFTLVDTPNSEVYIQIYINGVYQQKDTYSLAANVITFSEAPPTGTNNIEVMVISTVLLANIVSTVTAQDGITATKTGTNLDLTIQDGAIAVSKLSSRITDSVAISTLTGTVSFDMSLGSTFSLSGDLTGAYTINLTGYVKGQIITIYPLKGSTVTLAAQGTTSNTFYKLAEAEYDSSVLNILQIECADDSATDPVFFYSVASYASANTL